MRVVIDARTIQAQHSGVGTYVLELVRALARLGPRHEFRLLVHDPGLIDWASIPAVGMWRTRFSHESHPAGDLWESLRLPRQLERAAVDVFHGPAFLIPLRRTAVPLVVTIHDLVAFRHRETIPLRYGIYMRAVTRLAVQRARRIIVVSRTVRDELTELPGTDQERIRIVPLAVSEDFRAVPNDPAEDERRVRERYDLRSRYLLYVGNLEPRKNLPLLIRAFERVRDAGHHDVVLALTGKWGWLYDGIRRAVAESRARGAVRLLGYVPREDLPSLYRGAAAFTFPSVWEGFGLPVLEAMAAGAPVVASDVAAIPEVAGGAALLVPPGNEEAFAEALVSVLGDPTVAQSLRERGRKRAASYSWDEVARRTLEVYTEAAGD